MAEEDLKYEIMELKKRMHSISSENNLLKVRVRKLQTEVDKKNKQIECLLDPKKTTCIRKIISERGATMIMNLKQRNYELEQIIETKDGLIKKLQLDIQTSKLYLTKDSTHHVRNTDNRHIPLKSCKECNFDTYNRNNKFRSRSVSTTPTPRQPYLKSSSDIQVEYVRLAQNLQKIKSAKSETKASAYKRPLSHNSLIFDKTKNYIKEDNMLSAKSTISVDSCKTNNYETQDIEGYIVNMINEIEKLKETMSKLSVDQENTKKVIKDKNRNIEILTKKVKNLQKTKAKKSPSTVSSKSSQRSNEETVFINKYSQETFEKESNSSSERNNDDKINSETNDKKLMFVKQNTESTINESISSDDDDEDVETGDSR